MLVVVLAIWIVGTWVTKYSLEEMALYTPIAVVALGALAGVILLSGKIVREALRRRPDSRAERAPGRVRGGGPLIVVAVGGPGAGLDHDQDRACVAVPAAVTARLQRQA